MNIQGRQSTMDGSTVRITCPEEGPAGPAPKHGGGVKTPAGKWISRGNGLRDGMRSRVVFPADMAEEIADMTDACIEQHEPTSVIEAWLVSEIARTTVQYRRAGLALDSDPERLQERARGPEWETDRNAVVTTLVGRLKKDAYGVIRKIEALKHGAEWALYMWQGLEENVASTGQLTEAQRDRAYDLLGVPVEIRPGSRKVPAADATLELRSLIDGEIRRLQALLPGLIESDRKLRAQAIAGTHLEPDALTRTRKSNESRAHSRLRWATATLERLRAGVPAESLIDHETGAPIKPGPTPAARVRPGTAKGSAARTTAAPTSAHAAAAAPPDGTAKVPQWPQHWPREDREAMTLAWFTLQNEPLMRRAPAPAPPPAASPEPPAAAG
jgi:hypothetical protein